MDQTVARYFDKQFGLEAVKILPGQFYSARRDIVIVTVLGSCVSACLWDPATHIGGMNHFMLPGEDTSLENVSGRYGLYSMELLINDMMHRGSRRSLLAAKVFGAASVMSCVAKERSVSAANERFVRQLLNNEGIPIACADLGGESGRRIAFFLDTGKVKVRRLGQTEVGRVQEAENRYRMKQAQAIKAPREMEVELF